MGKISGCLTLILVLLLVLSGTLNTLSAKVQNMQIVDEGGILKHFSHSFMQVELIFIGQSLALLIYFIRRTVNKSELEEREQKALEEGKEIHTNLFIYAIPAFFEVCQANLRLLALHLIATSVYEMLRKGALVTQFLFAILLLNMVPKKYQTVGSLLVFLGLNVVGLTPIIFGDIEQFSVSKGLQVLGYFLMIPGLFFQAFQWVYEEKLFHKYHIEPLFMVGMTGLFGILINGGIILALSFIHCPFGIKFCSYSDNGQPFMERPEQFFKQLQNPIILIATIVGIFSNMTSHICGVTITKYINSLTRRIAVTSRTICVWTVGIIVTLTLGVHDKNYKWESLNPVIIGATVFGLFLLVLGNFIYNHVVVIECLQETDFLKDELIEKEQKIPVKDSTASQNNHVDTVKNVLLPLVET